MSVLLPGPFDFVAIIGSRELDETSVGTFGLTGPEWKAAQERTKAWRDAVWRFVRSLPSTTVIVSGGASGPDRWAVEAAKARKMPVLEVPADWTKGRGAGIQRNPIIVALATRRVVAFMRSPTAGTSHTIEVARAAGREVVVVADPSAVP